MEEQTINKKELWIETFKANYNGTSDEAKALEPYLKTTYKGDVYIPWATMERLVYMQDPEAKFTNILTDKGGLVHTDSVVNKQFNKQNDAIVSETESTMFSHFVKVCLVFMGKTFIEDYPIQDQDYSAARIFNQNLVNKALQRAKAKVAARATGLGLRLYEGLDLQYDNATEEKPTLIVNSDTDVESKKETVKAKKTKKVTEPDVNETVEETIEEKVESAVETIVNNSEIPQDIADIIDLIKNEDEEKVMKVLQRVNVSIMKKYAFVLTREDTEAELADKLSKFPNIEQFKKTMTSLLG